MLPSDSGNGAAGERSEQDEKEAYARLANTRKRDLQEEFTRELEHDKPAKVPKIDDGSDEEDTIFESEPEVKPKTAAERMMEKMGYKEGKGLGKNAQGRAEPVALSTQRGRTGLGSTAGKVVARDFTEEWDESKEEKTIEEHVEWIPKCSDEKRREIADFLASDRHSQWIKIALKKLKIEDETEFCDEQVLLDMIKAKDVFDHMSDRDLREARTRANPYETIGSAFFQNRAAMKTANLDKVYDWIFSQEDTMDNKFLKKNPLDSSKPVNVDRESDLFYFADVCAGPGGFSEYMLWRKGFYNAKGFGFTLAGKDDFKLNKFCASSAYYFEPYYGVKNNGDVMDPQNIDSLEQFVMKGTHGKGVHLMMADGGFSVEGQENIQEILSKRLYLCQLLVSLCIVREGGNFFCKLFDIFTPFSVGLIYLMRICYDEISLHKPHTSRPANSERYIICKGLRKEYSDQVRDYLKEINRVMNSLKDRNDPNDVQEIIDINELKNDEEFFNAIVSHNEKLARRQKLYLDKYLSFSKNQGQFDKDQGNLREECLKYWMVPNRQRQRGREQIRQSLNALEVWGQWSPKLVCDSEFTFRPFEFIPNFLRTNIEKNIPYAAFRFVRLADKSQPMTLIAAADYVFINRNGRFENMDKQYVRIPQNTIIVVEEVKAIEKKDKMIREDHRSTILRILDAAVLNGDDVSKLSYEKRMKAAEKMCKALTLVNKEVKLGWGRQERIITPYTITAAQTFALDELDQMVGELEVLSHRQETNPIFVENGHTYVCKGLRITRILKPEWMVGWSKSQQLQFAWAPKKNTPSIFEEQWESSGCYASYWETSIVTRKEHPRIIERIKERNGIDVPVPCTVWKWTHDLRSNYGPLKILEDEQEFNGLPTMEETRAEKTEEEIKAEKEKKHLEEQQKNYRCLCRIYNKMVSRLNAHGFLKLHVIMELQKFAQIYVTGRSEQIHHAYKEMNEKISQLAEEFSPGCQLRTHDLFHVILKEFQLMERRLSTEDEFGKTIVRKNILITVMNRWRCQPAIMNPEPVDRKIGYTYAVRKRSERIRAKVITYK
ncbi:unnamed protein product [Caenorhabditis bovis]|uniref:Cap-specific mRNA (nucleoside-2'-O-)-methyltransferase 1 n=1 Tax=Caenorhabditis bovis TaxID=2654633 RepID=A0A8S1EWK5_9PELO|nr:unnamed protein product [Caenorhabditis bovis]